MKLLDTSTVLKDFEGNDIPKGDDKLTLRDVLLVYLSQGHAMGLTPQEQGEAYQLGMLVGGKTKELTLQSTQWDLLKKLCDSNKIRQGQSEEPIYPLLISQQAKQLVDNAPEAKK